ncbi:MAG: FHA domain-containing protein [Myxococcales bacterium]
MPAAKPPTRKPVPKVETTDPGGPPPVEAGSGDATLVYDKNKARPRGVDSPRLVIIAGPRKGTEHPLTEPLTTIGRGSDNVLVIPDISVSRLHSRLEKQGERWIVLDQGSGNGTRVNGKSIERYPLQHGDEIEMGDTRVQFVEPGGVVVKGSKLQAKFSEEVTGNKTPPPAVSWKKRAPLYGAVVVALVILLAAGLIKKRRQDAADAEAAAQGAESREFAQKRFQEGVALLKQGKWVEARDKLKIAAELDGQDPEIARYLESAQSEAPRAQQLAQAKAALARRDYAGARAALAGVPEDSALAESAHEVSRQIKEAIDAAVRDAKARVESGDSSAAQDLLDPVLLAEPSRPDVTAVKDAIAAQKRPQAPVVERRRTPAPVAQPPSEMQSVLEAYLAGDIGAAIGRARVSISPRAERMLQDLEIFDASYKDGLAKKQAGRTAEAVRALEQAAAADRAIGGGKDGRLGREVRKALSALHYQIGAAQTGGDDSLPQAAAHLRAAVQDDPSNDAAVAQLRQIADRCKEIYLRGYVAKDSDAEAARKAFKLVIETLPASDETAQKAKRWLDKLDGKVSKEE